MVFKTLRFTIILVIYLVDSAVGIVNGDLTEIDDHPYAASILANDIHICGGSIIQSRFILTAASCIENYKANDLKVRVGSSFYNSGGQLIDVNRLNIHPNYNQPKTQLNNVAILELSNPVLLGQNVEIVSIFRKNTEIGDGTIVGWGVLDRQSGLVRPYKPSEQLRYTIQPVIGDWTCDKNFLEGWDSNTMFCAGLSLKDNCIGDLGNPFVVDNVQIGMVSKTHTMCGRFPTAYVNVTYHLEFIYGILNS